MFRAIMALAFLLVSSSVAVFASESHEKSKKENIEVIEVVGQRTLTGLRRQARDAMFSFYDLYNALESDPEYKIVCYNESGNSAGSRIKTKVCASQYFRDMQARLTQAQLTRFQASGQFSQVSNSDVQMRLQLKESIAAEKMAERINQNPKLRAMFVEYIETKERYKNQHVQKYGT